MKRADGAAGHVYHLRVPVPQTGNVKEFKRLDLELTRDVNDHTPPPDPSQYGQIAAGLASDVVVLGAVLEPAPVTMDYTTDAPGNVWHDPQKAVFKTTFTNRSDKPQTVFAKSVVAGPGTGEQHGIPLEEKSASHRLDLKPGESRTEDFDLTPRKRGRYTVTLAASVDGRQVQRRDTTFAVLAPDTRKAVADSPFGVWEFRHAHSVARRPDQTERRAALMNKGGWRWTYGGSPVPRGTTGADADAELLRIREKYKITENLSGLPHSYQRAPGWFDEAEMKATFPTALDHALRVYDGSIKVMHESRTGLDLLRRYSEFLGGKPYDMPAEEKAKLDQQFENVKNYCLAVKKLNPNARIVLINDYPAVAVEFLKRKMPPEAFDAIGLEGAMFLRQPERQPDWLTVLGHHHEMRRAMKHYGYDKPLWTTEARYHPTAPRRAVAARAGGGLGPRGDDRPVARHPADGRGRHPQGPVGRLPRGVHVRAAGGSWSQPHRVHQLGNGSSRVYWRPACSADRASTAPAGRACSNAARAMTLTGGSAANRSKTSPRSMASALEGLDPTDPQEVTARQRRVHRAAPEDVPADRGRDGSGHPHAATGRHARPGRRCSGGPVGDVSARRAEGRGAVPSGGRVGAARAADRGR